MRPKSSTLWIGTLLILSSFALGCMGEIDGYYPPNPGDPDAASLPGDPDAAPVNTPDAYVPPNSPDAYVPPPPPDAAPPAYPPGPYGTNVNSTISNLSWTGYVDGPDGDSDPFNESSRTFALEEYYTGFDPAARIILINASAGWCGSCQEEMPDLRSLQNSYGSQGLRIVTALFEDTSGYPADVAFAKSWGQNFTLNFTVVADPSDKLGPYYVENAVPMNMFVDAATMKIVEVFHGSDYSYMQSVIQSYID